MKTFIARINLCLTNFFGALCSASCGLSENEREQWNREVDRLETIINKKK